MKKRKSYDNQLKAQVAREDIKNQRTLSQIASNYNLHLNQISLWKKKGLPGLPINFYP